MAVSFHPTTTSPGLHPQARLSLPPPSCATKHYSGLKLQSLGTFGAKNPNLTVEFYGKVNESLQPRTRNHRPSRAQVGMMPIGTPKVPYRTPGEGTWQWVDLWNAL
ncbi:ATP-dependent Clp protease proteolytic subunit-related protein 2, partial [Pyrus ussuriensis x Pyrus communis]